MEALVSEISKIGTAPKPQMHLRTPGTHLLRAIGAIGRPKGCCCEPQGCSERSAWKICTRPGWTRTFGTRLPGELRCSFYSLHRTCRVLYAEAQYIVLLQNMSTGKRHIINMYIRRCDHITILRTVSCTIHARICLGTQIPSLAAEPCTCCCVLVGA